MPDGRTATQVQAQGSGRTTVNIASPTRDGVSYNSYTQFSVGRPGADINNTEAAARVIVNEVRGTLPSVIEGDITVLGRRANFVLANENGIKVDGGSFINMGSVALTTGKVELYDFKPTPDTTREDVLLRTNQGLIEIGSGGLTGAFNRLDLIAKNIRINGAINNTYDNANAAVRLIAGDSLAEINSSLSPSDDANDWLAFRGEGTKSQDLIVDITPLGSLSSGKIEIAVTDLGAGMRQAGTLLARAGDFVLASSGEVVFEGARNNVAGAAVVQAERVIMQADSTGQGTSLIAGGSIQILAPEYHLANTEIKAGGTGQAPAHVIIGVSDAPSDNESTIRSSTIQASGSILTGSEKQALQIAQSTFEANASIQLQGSRLAITASPDASYFSTIDARGGVLSVKASDEVMIEGARLQGAAAIELDAARLTLRQPSAAKGDAATQMVSNGGNIEVRTSGDMKIEGGEMLALNSIVLDAGSDIHLSSQGNHQAKVFASEGTLLIGSKGSFINEGGYLHGKTADSEIDGADGGVTIHAELGFRNITSQPEQLAIVFSEAGDVKITTAGDFVNQSGRVIANGNLLIAAGGDVRNILEKTPGDNGEQKITYQGTKRRFFGLLRSKKQGYSIDYGAPLVGGQLAYLVADGDLHISGRNVVSTGGDIAANSGTLSVTAEEKIINQTVRVGQVEYSSSCYFLGCQRQAQSSVTFLGGSMGASDEIRLSAKESVTNQGGRIDGINGITIDAPQTLLQSLENYQITARTHGMRSFYGDTYARVYRNDTGGVLQSDQGSITVRGDVTLDGGQLSAGDRQIQVDGQTIRLRDPVREIPDLDNVHDGIFSFL